MLLTIDSPDFNRVAVFLDGKLIRACQAAMSGEEGWVDVIDPAAMAPLDLNRGNPGVLGDDEVNYTEIITTRKFGKVEFRRI